MADSAPPPKKPEDQEKQEDKDYDSFELVSLFEPPAAVIVCEFGNVILIADDGYHPPIKIEISSCILATSSPVFRALFSKNFAEGVKIQEANSRGEIAEIVVCDPPNPFLTLCRLLHLQGNDERITAYELMELAVLVHKYDCVDALRLALSGFLNTFKEAELSGHECDFAVAAAYLLDQPEYFRHFSKQLVLRRDTRAFSEKSLERLPKEFLRKHTYSFYSAVLALEPQLTLTASIRAQQALLSSELTYSLTKLLEDFTAAAFAIDKPNYIRVFTRSLTSQGLWPLDVRHNFLITLLNALNRVEVPAIEASHCPGEKYVPQEPERGFEDYWDRSPSLVRWKPEPPAKPPRRANVEAVKRHVEGLCVGVCLDCLEGRTPCRVPHTQPWECVPWDFLDGRLTCLDWNDDDASLITVSKVKPAEWEDMW